MNIHNLQELKAEMEIQNGRAAIQLSLPDLSAGIGDYFLIYLWDNREQLVFHCAHPAGEEDPCAIQLMRPNLWEGTKKPYRYRLEIYGEKLELLCRMPLPIRTLTEVAEKGYFLNGRPFVPRGVYYDNPRALCSGRGELSGERLQHSFRQLVQMGANAIILKNMTDASQKERRILQEACDELGLVFFAEGNVPEHSVQGENLFWANGLPTAAYYLQKARWGSEPFVYIDSRSLQRQSDGSYCITVYSNQKKVALLLNGRVFGFQGEGPEFVFWDIPVKYFPLLLAAEAGESRMSVTCYGC